MISFWCFFLTFVSIWMLMGNNPSYRSRRMSPNCQHRYSTSRSPSPRTHMSRLSRSQSQHSRSTDRVHWPRSQATSSWSRPTPSSSAWLPPCPSRRRWGPGLPTEFPWRVFSPHGGGCKKLFDDLLHPPELSHYTDSYPANDEENTQLVPYHKDPAEGKTVLAADNLETHDGSLRTTSRSTDFLVNRIVMPGPWLTET